MKIFLLASLLLLLWAISCNKEKETPGLTIVYGSECGWCAGEDSIIITESKLNYRKMNSCDRHAYSKICPIGKSDWDNLAASVNFEEFSTIHLNTCNVCFDGCDRWITIRDGSRFHKIRFGLQDSAALQPVKILLHKLDSLVGIHRPAGEI